MQGDPTRSFDDAIQLVIEELSSEHGLAVTVADRMLRLTNAVPGQPHLATLQVLGVVARAGITGAMGAAAFGPVGVAASVWASPELCVARWTGPSRWVAAYKFPARGRPDDYLREETSIPSHMGRGSWYGEVPDEIAELFFSVGQLLDEPPFPVPQPPPAAKPEPKPSAAPRPRSTAAPRERAPRAPRPKAPPAAPKQVALSTRACPSCNLQKHVSQFEPGSDLCVDCR